MHLLVNFKKTRKGKHPTAKNLVEFLHNNKDKSKACSAEIQTMNGIDIKRGDYLYFISSGDEDGLMCGEALSQAYNQFGYYSKNIPIPGLTKNYDSFKKFGLPQFIQALVNIIESHGNNANIIATGGFKAETAYAAMVGSLTEVSVYYIHEDFQNVIELPGLPVGLDFSAWTTYFNNVNRSSCNCAKQGQIAFVFVQNVASDRKGLSVGKTHMQRCNNLFAFHAQIKFVHNLLGCKINGPEYIFFISL